MLGGSAGCAPDYLPAGFGAAGAAALGALAFKLASTCGVMSMVLVA